MRKLIVFLLLFISLPVFAKIADSKNFSTSADNIFMITLGVLKKLNFSVVEMQSSSGYILFKTPSEDEYLILITEVSDIASNIKISKLKQTSPLVEIQDIIYNGIANDMDNIPKKAEL